MGKQTVTVTILHTDGTGYRKAEYSGCFWEEDQQARIVKTGLASADSLYISIPWQDGFVITKGKDKAVLGTITEEVDNTSSATVSASIKQITNAHEVFTLTSCSPHNHGSKRMWHYELSGK